MISFKLVEATPFRLRYLAFQDGVISSPPLPSDGFATIPNDGVPSPDLLTDATDGANETGGGAVGNRTLLVNIVRARLDGIGVIPAGTPLTQAQARALLLSDDPTEALLTNNNVPRAIVTAQCSVRVFVPGQPFNPLPSPLPTFAQLSSLVDFCVDANVDLQGDPVVEVRSGVGFPGFAYIDIYARHTINL